jgi:hypothetical protein
MVNINPFYRGHAQARQAEMGRKAATPERLQAIKDANKIPAVRVVPVDEAKRAVLVHLPTGRRFRPEGSMEWPMDRFTSRRLADGDIKIVVEEREEKPTRGRGTSGS